MSKPHNDDSSCDAHTHHHDGDAHAHHVHSHSHSHADHDHAAHASRGRIAWACCLTAAFMLVEVVGGVISGSLALLADAAHMLTDAGSLLLAWVGFWLADKPSDAKRSFGFGRFRILAAFANGLTLLLLAAWIIVEAIQRFFTPAPIESSILMGVAIAGLIVNIIAFFILHGGDDHSHGDVNLEGALWHVAGDMLGSVVAIIAALVIMFTGWTPIDPILSMIVAAIIGFGGFRVLKRSGHILLEGAPESFDSQKLIDDLMAHITGLTRVHHIHAWTLTGSDTMVTMNVCIADGTDTVSTLRAIKERLTHTHGMAHATIELSQADEEGDCLGTNAENIEHTHSH
ncbi:cation diffusion facilitator family transporter [Hirschia litorea]|uniref:Cation diffusion facilitator family transporter n=1 Tax=Hirschia litorea TaxID=1199156 RepID=A0ABW2IK59_9PROT